MTETIPAPPGHALLAGRRAVVTGAAGGIGAAIARAFEEAGASVSRWDVAEGPGILRCDVTDEAQVRAAFDLVEAEGPVDDVVHAAGILSVGPVADLSVEAFRRVLDVNLVGAFVVAREAAARLRRGGNLVLVASQAGLKGGAFWGAYSASKGGLLRLADCLTEELAPLGIRVNAISPGTVDTPMVEGAIAQLARLKGCTAGEIENAYRKAIPAGRFARPEEIGRAAVSLCSGLMSYANGANIVLDGGEMSR